MKFKNIKDIAEDFGFCIDELDSIETSETMTVFCFKTETSYMYIEVAKAEPSENINTLYYDVLVDNLYVNSGVIKDDIIQRF